MEADTGISIHALLAESDHYDNYNLHCVEISIHALLAESDAIHHQKIDELNNFYPRSPCGERLPEKSESLTTYLISIHALLAESDEPTTSRDNKHNVFLSTLSLRRATLGSVISGSRYRHFYPRSPCGERRKERKSYRRIRPISIHALLAESDDRRPVRSGHDLNFYPRSPCGERP